MTSASILRRLERLESIGDGSNRVVVMTRYGDEGDDVAEARWCEQHPGEAIPAAALRVIIRKLAGSPSGIGPTPALEARHG